MKRVDRHYDGGYNHHENRRPIAALNTKPVDECGVTLAYNSEKATIGYSDGAATTTTTS